MIESTSLLTEKEVASRLKVCQRTVYNLRMAGKLACVKVGKVIRYPVNEIERFIRESITVTTPINEAR